MPCSRLLLLPIVLAVAAAGAACGSGSPGACDGIGCSGHGYCVAVADIPYCVCAAGYHPVGAACEPNVAADPCDGIDCDGHGSCRVEAAEPTCDCAPTYEPLGALHCVPVSRPDAGADDAARDEAAGETADEAVETPAPRCGDGVIQAGEECDDGNAADDDDCLTSCRAARCGDGIVWLGNEECDTADAASCSTSCGTAGWQSCFDCRWTTCEALGDECNGIDDDCDGRTDEDGCTAGRYCLDATCWDEPTFEQGPACADLGVAHPPPDYLSYYQVRGRPGARVEKWNRHTSCPGAVAEAAPETAPPNDERIDADGIYRFEIQTDSPITDCGFEALGEWESWVIVDGLESGHVFSTYYLSSCSNVESCALGALFCPP